MSRWRLLPRLKPNANPVFEQVDDDVVNMGKRRFVITGDCAIYPDQTVWIGLDDDGRWTIVTKLSEATVFDYLTSARRVVSTFGEAQEYWHPVLHPECEDEEEQI